MQQYAGIYLLQKLL